MLAAASKNGDGIRTFELFRRVKRDGAEPISVTMLAVVDARVALTSLDQGEGRIEEAGEVVRRMPMKPSIRTWSSLISACRVHGKS